MDALWTIAGFVLVTAASILWHLWANGRGKAGSLPAVRACPRCRAVAEQNADYCQECGVPFSAYELVSAPVATEAEETGGRLHALVRADTCVGCGVCVDVCPVPGAIRLVGKLAVVDTNRCEGHGECAKACPVNGIALTAGAAVQRIVAPLLDAHFQSSVPGLYVVGELGGRGLIKNAVNEGRIAVEHIAVGQRRADPASGALDVLVVGSGPAGLSAGLEARRAGLRYAVFEQGDLSDTIHKYPRHKLLLAEPVRMPLYGNLWVADATKESLLQVWRTIIERTGLDVRVRHRVESVEPVGDEFRIRLEGQVVRARNVVLAMGRRGTPRQLGVPGEEAPKVLYDIVEMEAFQHSRVLVVGGGDSAIESAVGLANQDGTAVTLSYRGEAFQRIKQRNQEKLAAEEAKGRIRVLRKSRVLAIGADAVELELESGRETLPNDYVIVRIGGEPAYAFLERAGVQFVTKELAIAGPPSPGNAAGAAAAVLVALAGLSLGLTPRPLLAQVSPGPLASAHADLDKANLCFSCHARGGRMTNLCLDCHTEIAEQVAARRGLHGREARPKECASCHPDHAGRSFEMVHWDEGSPERFDHRRAGWPLTGGHDGLRCEECHQERFQVAPVAAKIRVRDHDRSWLGLDTACQSCHQDPHETRFGADCASCHSTADWQQIDEARFDHARTRYPLEGRHAAVACADCHDPAWPAGRNPAFGACGSCHADAHAGQARLAGNPADCASCHDVFGFVPARFSVSRHAQTSYPLEGEHAAVACERCHTRGSVSTLGTARVDLSPEFSECRTCHADAHAGQTVTGYDGDCATCHTVHGFRPSSIDAKAHARFDMVLEGGHETIACRECHGADRAGLPAPAGEAGTAGFRFAIEERTCESCHKDPHQGRFTAERTGAGDAACTACHDTHAFRPSQMDLDVHSQLGFALTGAHRAVPCQECHLDLHGRPQLGRGSSLLLAAHAPEPLLLDQAVRDCASCHETPHGGQFAERSDQGACDACHGTDAFRPAVQFDHDRDTRFPLEGSHAEVACAECHLPASTATEPTRYRGVDARCEACHGGGGRLGSLSPDRALAQQLLSPRKGAHANGTD